MKMTKVTFKYGDKIIKAETTEFWTEDNWNIRIYNEDGIGCLFGWAMSRKYKKRFPKPQPYDGNVVEINNNIILAAYQQLMMQVEREKNSAVAMTVLKPREIVKEEPKLQPRVEVKEEPKLKPRTRTSSGSTERF
jgi:hypothetical protein